MWDHLTFRYANIEITEIYYVIARDGDFKLMLKKGIQDVLTKEVEMLEGLLKKFGIPFPSEPRRIYENLGNIDISDQSMFRQVFLGMQSAAVVHAQALKQSTNNDNIRGVFRDLLSSELNVINNVIKYGKVKGWMDQVPNFSALK